jgi:DNA-binding IclR family transcriptional regulator
MTALYPLPGSNAERILEFIQQNPKATKNQIIRKLRMNPSVVRDILATLEEREFISDNRDERGHHHYSAKAPVL